MGDILSAEQVEEVRMSARGVSQPEPMDKDYKSSESRSSCFFLFGNTSLWPTAPAQPLPIRDMEEVDCLKHAQEEMHRALLSLQQDHLDLQLENRTLAAQNTHLRRALEDEEAAKVWADFDVVEEHYRQIERHRASAEVGGCHADLAAGISRAVADPGMKALLWAETSPKHHYIASPVRSARLSPPSPAQVF